MRQEFCAVVPEEGAPSGFIAIGEILWTRVIGAGFGPELHVLRSVHKINAHGMQHGSPNLRRIIGAGVFQRHFACNGYRRSHLGGEASRLYGSAGADWSRLVVCNHRLAVHKETILDVFFFRGGEIGYNSCGSEFRKGCSIHGVTGCQISAIIDHGIDRSLHIVRSRKDLFGNDSCEHEEFLRDRRRNLQT